MRKFILIIILFLKLGASTCLAQSSEQAREWEENNKKGLNLYNKGKFAEAVKVHSSASAQAVSLNDKFRLAASLHQKARTETFLDLAAADSDYKKAVSILMSLPASRENAVLGSYIYSDWSIAKWLSRRNQRTAIVFAQKAREMGVFLNDNRLIAYSCLQIGKIYYWQEKPLESIVWLEKARLLVDIEDIEASAEISEYFYNIGLSQIS